MSLPKFLVTLSWVILLLLAVTIWLYPSQEDFRAENHFWNGLSAFTEDFDPLLLNSLTNLPAVPRGTSLVLIPYLRFTEADLDAVKDYVFRGGTAVVLDDYGHGNQILDHLGLAPRFSGAPLRDPMLNVKNENFPKIVDFPAAAPGGEGDSIVLNHASALTDVPDSQVLARSSPFSFLDLDGDSERDSGEPVGPLPVAAHLEAGEGGVVLIADPSLLINSMRGMDNNSVFIQNIIQVQNSGSRIMVDQSHLPTTSLSATRGMLGTVRSILSTPLGTVGAVAIILMLALSPIWRRKEAELE